MKLRSADCEVSLETAVLCAEGYADPRMTFSADGSKMACWDYTTLPVRVWDTTSRRLTRTLFEESQVSVAFTLDGTRLATVSEESASAWDLETGACIGRFALEDVGFEAREIRFEDAGRTLALVTAPFACAWDVESGALIALHRFGQEDRGLRFAAPAGRNVCFTMYTPGESQASCSVRRQYLSKLDLRSGERLFKARSKDRPAFTLDGQWATCCTNLRDHRYEVWNTREGRCYGALAAPSELLFAELTPSADGRYIAQSSSVDQAILLWDVCKGNLATVLEMGGFYPVAGVSPTHQILAVVMNQQAENVDQTLFLDPLTSTVLGRTQGHPIGPDNHTFSPCGRWFASAVAEESSDYDGVIYLTDLAPILPLARRWEMTDR